MMSMKKDSFATPWKEVADRWEALYTPPGRPSSEDCLRYGDYIKRAKRGNCTHALVLGATPEIRNVLHNLSVEVTILDANLEMILAMNTFVARQEEDVLIRGNWVENPLADNFFDMVLGDLTWGNVPRAQWDNFHHTVRRVLKPEGYYIHRVTVIPEQWRVQPIEETLRHYGAMPFSQQRHFELFFHLLTDSYNPTTKTMSLNGVREILSPVWNGKTNIPGAGRLLERLFAFWGTLNKSWQTDYPSQLRKEIAPYFTILEEALSHDYLCAETSPFWFCQVKK